MWLFFLLVTTSVLGQTHFDFQPSFINLFPERKQIPSTRSPLLESIFSPLDLGQSNKVIENPVVSVDTLNKEDVVLLPQEENKDVPNLPVTMKPKQVVNKVVNKDLEDVLPLKQNKIVKHKPKVVPSKQKQPKSKMTSPKTKIPINKPILKKPILKPIIKKPKLQKPIESLPPSSKFSAFSQDCLNTHNSVRNQRSISSLNWSPSLQAKAQRHANAQIQLSKQGKGLTHIDKSTPENLYGIYGSSTVSCSSAVMNWLSEESLYNKLGRPVVGNNPQFKGWGHYTQLMWSGASSVGCAYAQSGNNGYVSCVYDTGNKQGQKPF